MASKTTFNMATAVQQTTTIAARIGGQWTEGQDTALRSVADKCAQIVEGFDATIKQARTRWVSAVDGRTASDYSLTDLVGQLNAQAKLDGASKAPFTADSKDMQIVWSLSMCGHTANTLAGYLVAVSGVHSLPGYATWLRDKFAAGLVDADGKVTPAGQKIIDDRKVAGEKRRKLAKAAVKPISDTDHATAILATATDRVDSVLALKVAIHDMELELARVEKALTDSQRKTLTTKYEKAILANA